MITTIDWLGGTEYTVANAPPGYETMHFGDLFVGSTPVPPGEYTVTMTFIEPTVQNVAGRIFSVTINETPVLWRFDLFASEGFMMPAERKVPVSVGRGGRMVFLFKADVRYALVSGITIEPLTNDLLTIS
jgi:hypothetical protein